MLDLPAFAGKLVELPGTILGKAGTGPPSDWNLKQAIFYVHLYMLLSWNASLFFRHRLLLYTSDVKSSN
jgi:hypothetical protein